ncbi:hypothetical protein [Maribacter antarcticus]|uniref:hypothetical protein n=1 Tax=Maribacter antarcticus TaxID=505250 RepID=UPI00373FCE02
MLFRLRNTKRQYSIDKGLGKLKTVCNYLRNLKKEDFLKSVKVIRDKLYLNYRLMAILEK